jgi:hypothetical protein
LSHSVIFCEGFFSIGSSRTICLGLALNRHLPDLCLLSSWDYRREPMGRAHHASDLACGISRVLGLGSKAPISFPRFQGGSEQRATETKWRQTCQGFLLDLVNLWAQLRSQCFLAKAV